MNQDVAAYLHKAEECLIDCQILVRESRFDAACNRAYYAFFDSIRALLASEGISINSHSAAQSLFGLHFIKTGLFANHYSRDVNRLMEKRQGGDYEPDIQLTQFDAEDSLRTAKDFVEAVRSYLQSTHL